MTGSVALLLPLGLACRPQAPPVVSPECAPDDWCQVSRTGMHVCALRGDGTPQCWGWNMGATSYEEIEEEMAYWDCSDCVDWGQVSLMLPGPFRQVEFAWLGETVCGLTFDGEVHCWGKDRHELSFVADEPITRFSLGSRQGCGILESGRVQCWGNLAEHPDWADWVEWSLDPPDVAERATQVSCGAYHYCALYESGRIRCWGVEKEELGTSVDYGQVSHTPADRRFQTLTTSPYGTCGFTEEGSWWCWGDRSWCGGDPTLCYWDLIDLTAPGGYAYDPEEDDRLWGPGSLTAPWLASFDMDYPACGVRSDGSLKCGSAIIEFDVPQPPSWLAFLQVDLEEGGCGVLPDHSLACWGSGLGSDFDQHGESLATYTDPDGMEKTSTWHLAP